MTDFVVHRATAAPPSPARVRPPERGLVRVAAVQLSWHPDPDRHRQVVAEGVALAAAEGAELVCLPELTLSAYMAVDGGGPRPGGPEPEALPGGPTQRLATELARLHGAHVHASLWEQPVPPAPDGRGYNTAICVSPDGALTARTRKVHLPVTEGYTEDRWFIAADPASPAFPVAEVGGARVGFPTCWDQWFPELSRAYALGGADLLVYPTAIGSEPAHPDFDTEPLWRRVMVGQAIANGLFVVAVNRVGTEGLLTFYGSSFVADPYGRVLVRAGRDEHAVLVADLDLDARRDWLELFPFLRTRRPEVYGALMAPGQP